MTARQTHSFVRAFVAAAVAAAFVLANNPVLLKAPIPTGLLIAALLLFLPLAWARRPRQPRRPVVMWPSF